MSGGAVLRPLPKPREKGSKREQAADHFLELIDGVIGEKTESGYKQMYKPAKEELKQRGEGEEPRMAGPEEVPEEPKFGEEEVKSEESPKEEDEEDILGQYLKKYKK